MDSSKRLTLPDLLCWLRDQLVLAREQKNKSYLQTLYTVFELIQDASWTIEDKMTYGLARELEHNASDSIMEAERSSIPSAEEIRRRLSE